MTTQQETIIWHNWKEDKPPIGKVIFVQYWDNLKVLKHFNTDMLTDDGKSIKRNDVIAWAEMPKGWKETDYAKQEAR